MNQQKATNCLIDFTTISPQKKLVSCQINRWIETKKKTPSPTKLRIIKKLPARTLALYQDNIQSLKRRKQQLLKSSDKKVRKSSIITKPSSTAATPPSIRRYVQNLPLIKVSQFNPQQQQKNTVKQIFGKNEGIGWINEIKRKNTQKRQSTKNKNKQLIPHHNYFQNRIIISTADLLRSQSHDYCGVTQLKKRLIINKKPIGN